MDRTFAIAAVWFGLALIATFLGTRFKISHALVEITVGALAGAVATSFSGPNALGAKQPWLVFIASAGAVLLTFFAGAELNPGTMRARSKEVLRAGPLEEG